VFQDGYKFKIGMKIPDDHPMVEGDGSNRFKIETTQLFRLIIKWIEDLTKIIESKEEILLERKHFKKIMDIKEEKSRKNKKKSK